MPELQAMIESVIRQRLGPSIEAVSVERGTDSDGDPVLNIIVVFDGKRAGVDAHRLVGIARHLRPRLEQQNVDAFPMVRLISKSDAAKMKNEAA